MHACRTSAAPCLLTTALLVLSTGLRADEDLAAKRELCQTEARQRIKPPRPNSVELFKIAVESRQVYVRECTARALIDPVSTASLRELIKATTGGSGSTVLRQR